MTTTVYLIRHSIKMAVPRGDYPVDADRIQPLTPEGEEKARALLNMEELRNADVACSSPFARTIATLKYLVEADNVPFSLDDGLKELEFGDLPGMPPKGTIGGSGNGKPPMPMPGGDGAGAGKPPFPMPGGDGAGAGKPPFPMPGGGGNGAPPFDFRALDESIRKQWEDHDYSVGGGESINQCGARMAEVINRLVAENPGKKILIGSHGGCISAYMATLIPGVDDAYTRTLTMPAVIRLRFEDGAVTENTRLL